MAPLFTKWLRKSQSMGSDNIDAEVAKEGKALKPVSLFFKRATSDSFLHARNTAGGEFVNKELDKESTRSVVKHQYTKLDSMTFNNKGLIKTVPGISASALSANASIPSAFVLLEKEDCFTIDSPENFISIDQSFFVPSRISNESAHSSQDSFRKSSITASSFSPPDSEASMSNFSENVDFSIGDFRAAGGAVGEDRVQVIYSESENFLYCGIYDGFNGRDAADFFASHFCPIFLHDLKAIECISRKSVSFYRIEEEKALTVENTAYTHFQGGPFSPYDTEHSQTLIRECLLDSLAKTESEFFDVVENELSSKRELAMVGCCLLGVLIKGDELFSINLGDSRAILATQSSSEDKSLKAIQLTVDHSVENGEEINRLEKEFPDEKVLEESKGRLRVKGKLRVTRAFGAGHLKKSAINDTLFGVFKVKDLENPPYISQTPLITSRKINPEDKFVVLGSDGLFDHFSNEEVVELVAGFLKDNPQEGSANFLLEEALKKAASKAGISVEALKSMPRGEQRRNIHDDISVIVVILENVKD